MSMSFDDDAFDDGGDHTSHFQFTSDAIRSELARQNGLSWAEGDDNVVEDVQLERETYDPDESVSTIDINSSRPYSPASISLPRSPEPRSHIEHGFGEPEDSRRRGADRVGTPSHRDYPVVIDVSKPEASTSASVSDHTLHGSSATTGTTKSSASDPSSSNGSQTTNSTRGLSVPSNGFQQTHRASRSGPSVLEQVISKTRPTHLPPKAKEEDVKHLAEWEAMMKQSKAIEEQKQKAREKRRLMREQAVEQSIGTWESSVLPDWKSAVQDAKLRRLWWNGVPPKLRGVVWEKAIGNSLALSKDTFRFCHARAQKALSSGSFPPSAMHLIEEDIASTLPTLHIFSLESGPLHQDLKDLLCAWVVSRSDEGLGYSIGASKIGAMLLLNMSLPVAFVAMRNLLERHCLRSFYGGLSSKDDVEAYYRIFDTLLADRMPKIYFNFKQHQVSPAAYLPEWILPTFLDHLPLEACARIWDVMVLEGDSFLFRAALGLLASLESRLFFPDRRELLDLLAGKDKAAYEAAKRQGMVIGACRYEIYSLDEEVVWEQIEALNDWWKENTWTRLIQRELPDM